jgi:hypothetical protein
VFGAPGFWFPGFGIPESIGKRGKLNVKLESKAWGLLTCIVITNHYTSLSVRAAILVPASYSVFIAFPIGEIQQSSADTTTKKIDHNIPLRWHLHGYQLARLN